MKREYFKYYLACAVSLITFIVYIPTLRNDFVNWDDPDYVTENFPIRSLSTTFLKWAFFDFHASNWHPLTWISHALDYAVWGLNPLGHHLINNLLHAANTFLVVVLVIRLAEAWRRTAAKESAVLLSDERSILVTGVGTGLLFGLHPLHVESVAWVAERKDLLCALFFLLSIMSYTKYVKTATMSFPPAGAEDPSLTLHSAKRKEQRAATSMPYGPGPMLSFKGSLLSALCFFALALLSKPMAVTLPAVLLILDWFPFQRIGTWKTFWRVCMEKLPFIALSLISSVLTLMAQSRAIHPVEALPLSTRLLVATKSLVAYLWKMIVPVKLLPFYPYPQDATVLSIEYLSAIVLVLGLTTICLVTIKRQKVFLSLWGYYVVTLIPVLGIIQVGFQSMADRYTYLPSLGPFLLVGLGLAWVLAKVSTLTRQAQIIKIVAAGTVILASVSVVYLTSQQIKVWKNSFDLWDYVIAKEPGKVSLAYKNRGEALSEIGQFERAIADYDMAIALNPSNYEAHNNRGVAFDGIGRPDKAMADYDKAIALNPRLYDAYNNKGKIYGQTGSFGLAIEQFTKAIEIKKDLWLAYCNRGLAYFLIREYEKALEDLTRAIELDRNYTDAYGIRGNVYLVTGRKELASSDFQKACSLGNQKACEALQALRFRDQERQ